MPKVKFNMNTDQLSGLYSLPICKHMSEKQALTFANHLTGLQYSKGNMLFTQGDHLDDHLFIILDGQVDISTHSQENAGSGTSIFSQKAGGTVGILSFIDGRNHIATAQAKSDVHVAIITRQDYVHFKSMHPDIATIILEYLIIAADNFACQMVNKFSESMDYINSQSRPRSLAS